MSTEQIATLKAEIAELDLQIKFLGTQRGQKRTELAALFCPFKVGDILVNEKGQRAQITSIAPGYFSDGYKMTGAYYKRDGTLGIREGELWHEDWSKE